MAKIMEIISKETGGKVITRKSIPMTQLVCHHLTTMTMAKNL